jgi:hypothetical protein
MMGKLGPGSLVRLFVNQKLEKEVASLAGHASGRTSHLRMYGKDEHF